jgi:phosphohistidine swiveling domain-containing protein/membrane-associated phospholipid phosphatase
MDERLALVLSGAGTTIAAAGGKAHALDRLIAIGAPVPACGVLTTAAYREFVASPILAARLAAVRDEPLPAFTADVDARRRVDEMFLEAPMPPSVRAALDDLVEAVAGAGRVAIRSSATAEDLGAVSFAGQYRSFLDIAPADAERAVRLTWASLWHPAPRAYRSYHGVDDRDLAMALIVMRMLAPDVAGVAFTRDPRGAPDRMRVELVHGLGESLVSGAVTPEAFVVERSGTDVDLATVAAPLAGLPAIAVEVEERLGAPQDLEWAVEGDRLWLLQSRPITTSDSEGVDDGFDVGRADAADWTTAGIAEMLPGVMPPRLWELDSWLVEEAFRRLFCQLGGDVTTLAEPHALLARYRARAALDLTVMRTVITSIPGASTTELERQYFGDAAPSATSRDTHAGWRQGVRVARARHAAVAESEVVMRAVDLLLDREPDLRALDDDELLAFASRVRDFTARVMSSEVTVAALAAAAYRAVESLLARHVGADEARHLAQQVTGDRAAAGNALTRAFALLVDEARRDPDVGRQLQGGDGAGVARRRTAASQHRYDTIVRRAGSRSVCGGPTWSEAPEQALDTFQAMLVRRLAPRGDDAASRCVARAGAEDLVHREPRWRAVRAAGGMLADPRRAFLRREADDAAVLLERRELVKDAVLMVGGVTRRVDLEIGRRLVERHDLVEVADIDVLTFAESAGLLRRDRAPSTVSAAMIATRRRRLRSAELNGPLPRRFNGRTPPASMPLGAAIGHGWGASPGRYEGVARFVESPRRAAGFRRGDVLVARTTDASWMPLFLNAGAIVIEEGGPLSHAAIVARELGVPTIVNVPGIVDRLAGVPDAVIAVDGTTGDVTIRDPDPGLPPPPEPAAGVVPARTPPAIEGAVALQVFVTGLIGAGALLSVAVSLTEKLGGVRGRARLRRRSEPVAQTLSAGIVHGFDDAATGSVGVRSRRWYASVATGLVGAAIALGVRSIVDYWRSDPSSWGSVMAWSAGSTSAMTLLWGGVLAAGAAHRWPAVGSSLRRLFAPRSTAPRLADVLGRRRRAIVAGSLSLAALLGVLVAARAGPLDRLDRHLYDAIDAGATADRYAPDWMNLLGRPWVVIPLACVLAVVVRRCRVLAVSIPAAIVGTGATVAALTWLTMRDRPPFGHHAGEQNSFPGGHAAQLTLLFGLLVLVARVVISRRSVQIGAAAASSMILLVVLADTVRTGGHWPSDQLAGFLIAAAVLVTVDARVRAPASHADCGGSCPMKEVDDDHHRAAG